MWYGVASEISIDCSSGLAKDMFTWNCTIVRYFSRFSLNNSNSLLRIVSVSLLKFFI